jgi:5-methylcytosine-specific restriction endonuclease McrA
MHGRPVNASWSTDRDRGAQHAFRQAVLARDGHACTRCHRDDVALVAHHVRPGYDVSAGITLCDDCHADVDTHAR